MKKFTVIFGILVISLLVLSSCSLNRTSHKMNNQEIQTEKPTMKPTEKSTAEKLNQHLSLESWIGDYKFSEFASPDENMFYEISIYKENDVYYSRISIDGFQTLKRLQAKIEGDEHSITFVFKEYLPQNVFEPYKVGDVLLRFEKKGSDLYTFWEKIVPLRKDNQPSGKIYFKTPPLAETPNAALTSPSVKISETDQTTTTPTKPDLVTKDMVEKYYAGDNYSGVFIEVGDDIDGDPNYFGVNMASKGKGTGAYYKVNKKTGDVFSHLEDNPIYNILKKINEPSIKLFEPNTNGNLNNDGFAVRYKDTVVFSDENGGIYSTNLFGQNFTKLSNQYAGCMNVYDHFLYYCNNGSIYRLDLDNNTSETIFQGGEKQFVQWMSTYEKYLLFYNGKLMKIDLEKNSVDLMIDEPMYSINIYENILYYQQYDPATKKSNINLLDLSSKKVKIVKDNIEALYSITLYDNWIYYIIRPAMPGNKLGCACSINKIDLSGNNNTPVREINQNIHSLNIVDDWIYYVRSDDKSFEVIARIDIKNPSNEEILPLAPTYRLYRGSWEKVSGNNPFDSPTSLNIIDKWIFYNNVYGHNAYLQSLHLK